MSIDRDFLLEALLQHNYMPAQKECHDELPLVISTRLLTPTIAKKLADSKSRPRNAYPGYDSVEYRLTRFNGVPRACSIPHPRPYAALARRIHEHWDRLEPLLQDDNSRIYPLEHNDGRVITMDYDSSTQKADRELKLSFGKRFIAHTDIANFFPSIYSHSIPWAAVGFTEAKSEWGRDKSHWFNQIDHGLREMKRAETQGIGIGSAISNILSELVLARVDTALRDEFAFVRFIDDYTAYCSSETEAQDFIRRLIVELAKFKLLLNIKKTEVVALPRPLVPDWMSSLSLALPSNEMMTGGQAMAYLNHAVTLAADSPDGSVIKYAFKCLINHGLSESATFIVVRSAVSLSFFQPALLPLLDSLFAATIDTEAFPYSRQLQVLGIEHARWRRSDALAWILYYCLKFKVTIDDDLAEAVIASEDCVALLLLYQCGQRKHRTRVNRFARQLEKNDLYRLDQYWLLLYELYRCDEIEDPYSESKENAFDILKSAGVSFVDRSVLQLRRGVRRAAAAESPEL